MTEVVFEAAEEPDGGFTAGALGEGISCRNRDHVEVHRARSQMILQTSIPVPERIAVPVHEALRMGTLDGFVRAVAAHSGRDREAIPRGI